MINALILIIASLAFLMGLIFYRKPASMIEFQRRFYALINWRLEPISIKKEIRNTKAMGLFLIVFVVLMIIFVVCHL